ncbi:hypothetical protein BX616_000625 [Lobosporangium transversale]|uniref:Uncharacterized protein n=1 Tax=Lobosporangium transversale TaxID=64571 RepID=A0A1Y2GEE3_9FUNG|nr:hypothetical protein BCR41DRAFT_373224 [Lobosporangium transversale]KAF9906799.1 hypothetical protein BX616_000625 [Lobosporangium transversale]ORZ08526.1 hypothetical protein BCR41DRAFT_373224 [Lobosporangium transversale]|eukprot:XP_021878454.1 hypothetical protein BCR41DRAFT_373224 [Lobosporangium transversale]
MRPKRRVKNWAKFITCWLLRSSAADRFPESKEHPGLKGNKPITDLQPETPSQVKKLDRLLQTLAISPKSTTELRVRLEEPHSQLRGNCAAIEISKGSKRTRVKASCLIGWLDKVILG